jgi:hypothetical protein
MMGLTRKRLQSDEEIMALALDKRGSLQVRIIFQVYDAAGTWRVMRNQGVTLTKIPTQGRLLSLLNGVRSYLSGCTL